MDNRVSIRLGKAFLGRAEARLEALEALKHEAEPLDVVREARDIADLGIRSMLRAIGVEVPRWREVDDVLLEQVSRFPADVRLQRDKLLTISEGLRPSQQPEDPNLPPVSPASKAERATADALWVVELARLNIDLVAHSQVPAASIP